MENITKEQAILSEAKTLIETYLGFLESSIETSENRPPTSVLSAVISCKEVLRWIATASDSVADPKETGEVITHQYLTGPDHMAAQIQKSESQTFSGPAPVKTAPKEHVYTDKEIIGLAEKEIESLRQQLKDMNDVVKDLKKELAGVKKPGVETRPYKDYNEFDQEQRGWKPK